MKRIVEDDDLWKLVGWLVALFTLAFGFLAFCIWFGISLWS